MKYNILIHMINNYLSQEKLTFINPETLNNFVQKLQNDQLQLFNGATKCVFVLPDTHYVLKMPYNSHHCRYLYAGADAAQEWNYCAAEMTIYQKAKQMNASDIFVKNKRIRSKYPLYLQEKCHPLIDTLSLPEPSLTIYTSWYKHHNSSDDIYNEEEYEIWTEDVINFYGNEQGTYLLDYISENIDDLHSGNIGYLCHNLQPVVFDYGGFYD